MSLINRLQIILITYNRVTFLQKTFQQIFVPESPIRDFDITILDNCSTDGTTNLINDTVIAHPNVKYIRHHHNVGGNANIAKAMEMATKEYVWIICDDDDYNWDNWGYLENAILQGEELICIADFNLPESYRNDLPYKFHQMTFLPSIIINTKLLTDTAIRNAYDSSVFLFPHLAPVVMHLNHGGNIHVIEKPIVHFGVHPVDNSFTRGSSPTETFIRSRSMNIVVGFANLCSNLTDKKLARRCFYARVKGEHGEGGGMRQLYRDVFLHMNGRCNYMQVADIKHMLPFMQRVIVSFIYWLSCTPIRSLLVDSILYKFLRKREDIRNQKLNSPVEKQ